MNASATMMLPVKTMISRPMIAAIALLSFFWLASIVFAQTPSSSQTAAAEDLFSWIGRILVVVSLLGIAVAAIYNTVRKAALNEYKELAEARKGKLVEMQLELARQDTRIKFLEQANEDLEKKNLRLQKEE